MSAPRQRIAEAQENVDRTTGVSDIVPISVAVHVVHHRKQLA